MEMAFLQGTIIMEGRHGSRDALSYPQTLGSYLFRRGLHLANVLFFIYYLLPDPVLFLPKRAGVVVLFMIIPLMVEIVRTRKGVVLLGQRLHEDRMPGSYAWSLWSTTLIILILPQQIALPVIMIYAIGDPIIGEIRLWRKNLALPLGFIILFLLFLPFGYGIIPCAVGSLFMIIGEALELVGELRVRPELLRFYGKGESFLNRIYFKTDDDATTQVIPAVALGVLYLLWPGLFPEPLFWPLF